MEAKEVGEDRPSSPYLVLQQASGEAFKAEGGAVHSVYNDGGSNGSTRGPGHRRSLSEVMTWRHRRTNSFQKWKAQVQKAWRWGGSLKEQGGVSSFNPEILANQKRQWYQLHPKTMDQNKVEPTSLFEHFIVAGLQPDANLEMVEDAFARRKRWESEILNSETIDFPLLQHRGPSVPTLVPQILFKYPPGRRLALRLKDLAAFCFPGGVKARMLERTPSLSDINELVYGQEHLGRDDLSFIFSLKTADSSTLYGVCLHVPEIVQRPPGILGISSPLPLSSGGCRFLVSAPRCYCILTKVPFFELHYEMLNSIIAQERLNRITQFINEMTLASYVPPVHHQHDEMSENAGSIDSECSAEWMATAIPVNAAVALTAAAAGLVQDDEIPSPSIKFWEPESPESVTASETSDLSHTRETDKDVGRTMQCMDDNTSETSESRSDCFERMSPFSENGHASPEVGSLLRIHTMDRLESFESLLSPVRGTASEDEVDEFFSNCEKDFGDDVMMEWARENKNELLQIVCSYHALPLPSRGSELVFQPLEHLQAIAYRRPQVSALGLNKLGIDLLDSAQVNSKSAAAEEALALSIWTVATICRVLSLESILALVSGVLLEKQLILVCPNLGILSATVLSVIPMIRPFEWQSLLLPVLPDKMLDFLDAPVPFIVGVQHKPGDLKIKASNLVLINLLKDQVKTCQLPALPRQKELVSDLRPFHARLSYEGSTARSRPVYRCSDAQAEAAIGFLSILRYYLESLCSDLRSHTITSVQSNNDRVSLLLKDSFIDSFSSKDRSFIKLFVDTQIFTVLSDARLSTFESRRF